MADSSRYPDSKPQPDQAAVGRDSEAGPGMPRWVRVFLIVGVAVVLLFAVAKVTGVGGDHGPGRHGGGGGTPAVHEDGDHKPPVVHHP